LAENREWIKTPGHTGLVTGISHAWNVKDGKIYDTTLGSKEAADYLYFGFKVPDDVVKNLKNGDELANWHTSQMKYAQWDESKHPRSPTFNPADKRISYANAFEPTEAMKAFENRAWMIKDVIDSRLQSAVRQELFEHLKGGRTMGDTISRLRDIFAPYVGDPSSGAPGSLLSAARLENIVRTETTWAYNQGRLAVGDALGDYILGYQFSAILDERTTETCQTADGLVLQKDDATTIQLTPPLHFQCRSMLVYVTVDDAPVEWSGDKEIDAAVSLIQAGFK
jgi:SPP1 gp7 family putative phage head morphogenesis protein